jgi:hypothetical protein
MSGTVTDADGALTGATIMAIHLPTGTQSGTVTDSKGYFRLQNLKPGGPYKVSIAFVGYRTVEHNDISLVLADNYVLNVQMSEDAKNLTEVVVVANALNSNMNSDRAGALTSLNARDMALMPSISRSINDMTRLTPQSNGQSIGGGNYRQNFITVDGAAFNNAFGIGQNLPGNGSPISVDALDQISVVLTPYDVRQSGFIGAAVNAVTKSGTNEFKGSLYTYMTDDRLRGNKVEDEYFTKPPSSYNLYGLTLGGPVIKDKLFFFVNFEKEKTVEPGPTSTASTDGIGNGTTIARPTVSDMEMMSKYLNDKYGYQTGPYQGYSFDSPGQKFLARIDWNINDRHKVNLRYSYMDSKKPTIPSGSTSPFSSLYIGGRTGMDAMWYRNSGYFQEQNFSSLSGEWNSTYMGGQLSNSFRATYSFQDEPRSVSGNKDFPFVDILKDGRPYTSFGTEIFSYGNLRQVKTYNVTEEIKYSSGINNYTLGLSYEKNQTKNGFMRFGTGFYVFDSWDDFTNGGLPSAYGITFSNTPGYAQAFPSFKFDQYSFYLQDEVKLGNNLTLTGGVRFDLPIYPEALAEHPMISKLDFNGKHYSTANLPKTRLMFSPRFGFNYDFTGERQVVVRGGTGIFTGRIPFVWICSQAVDAGMLQSTMMYRGEDVPGPFNPDPKAYYPKNQPQAGTSIPTGGFTVMDPEFKMPSAWKSSVAVDFKLPLGFNASIEGVYNKDINAVMVYKEGLVEPVRMNIPGYPDHRLVYPSGAAKFLNRLNSSGIPNATGNNGATPFFVTNAKDGNGYYSSVTVKVDKNLWEGLSAMVAYTRSFAKSLHDGWGDQMSTVWNGYPTVNGSNTPELGYASYVMPNNLIGSLSYRFGGFTTSVFYTGTNSGRGSYFYSSNIVQDGASTSSNLIYVPKDPSEIQFVDYKSGDNVIWTAQQQSDAFFRYIEQDEYLRTRKGQYAEKNAVVFPWQHRFDVKFTQDFTVKAGKTKNTLQLGLDITNFGNLLNSKWGNTYAMNQAQLLIMTNASAVTPDGNVVPTFNLNRIAGTSELPEQTFRKVVGNLSTYYMQFSVRYIFN